MTKKKSTRDKVINVSKHRDPIPARDDYPKTSPSKAPTPRAGKERINKDPGEITIKAGKPEKPKKEQVKKEKSPKKASKPFLKSRAFWGLASLFLAFIVAFVIMPAVENNISERVSVIVAAQDIPEGTKIESSMLKKEDKSKSDVQDSALFSVEDAVGKYTQVEMLSEDMLTTVKVADAYYEDSYLYDIPDGKMAMSIELADLAQSVSGKLRSGDVIRIYAVYKNNADSEDENDYAASLINALQYVEVLAVTNSNVQDIGGSSADDDSDNSKDSKSIATVTLLVNNKQAEVLAGLNNNASLYAALVVRGDDVKKQAALETEDKYFENLEAAENGESVENKETLEETEQ